MPDDTSLLGALEVIQARGAIGERSLVDAVAHADRFVALIPEWAMSVVDLGSGGGLPALVIAWRRPDLTVTLVERRAARADLLRRAIASLKLQDHSRVLTADVTAVCKSSGASFEVVTARSFADPATTARFVEKLLVPGGVALISEPPVDRSPLWSAAVAHCGELIDEGVHQGIRRLAKRS